MIDLSRLRDIREDKDINQNTMATILGVNRSTYSLWELGINIIPLNPLCDFANYFHLSIDYVLGLTHKRVYQSNPIILDLTKLGNNIKELRDKHHLSQSQLAEMLDVSQACIAKYERGLICISTSNLYMLSRKFNISLTQLCTK